MQLGGRAPGGRPSGYYFCSMAFLMANILVVDDDHSVASPLIMYFEFRGHKVRYADNGESGLRAVAKSFPDVIVLDVEMPQLTGPEMAYRLLVEDSGREKIPIILLSGVADLSTVAKKVGTPYLLAKPYSLDDLEAVFEKVLRERIPPRPAGILGEAVQ